MTNRVKKDNLNITGSQNFFTKRKNKTKKEGTKEKLVVHRVSLVNPLGEDGGNFSKRCRIDVLPLQEKSLLQQRIFRRIDCEQDP